MSPSQRSLHVTVNITNHTRDLEHYSVPTVVKSTKPQIIMYKQVFAKIVILFTLFRTMLNCDMDCIRKQLCDWIASRLEAGQTGWMRRPV